MVLPQTETIPISTMQSLKSYIKIPCFLQQNSLHFYHVHVYLHLFRIKTIFVTVSSVGIVLLLFVAAALE